DVGGCHRRSVGGRVAGVQVVGDDAYARSGDVDARVPVVGEVRELVGLVGRADAEDVGQRVRARVGGAGDAVHVGAVVPGRDDGERVRVRGDRLVLDVGRLVGAQRGVDHAAPGVAGGIERGGDVGGRTAALGVERAQRHNASQRGDADHADAVLGGG